MCRNAAPGISMISQLVAGVTARRVRGSDRSNSLNTPNIPNSILPDGVLVSRACWCR